MPFFHRFKNELPRSVRLEQSTYKNGFRHAVFAKNGYKYIGEWKNDKKHGKGTEYIPLRGQLYQGDFENNLRHGFGVLAQYHPKTRSYRLIYRGTFIKGKEAGSGLRFYYTSDGPYCYLGRFARGKRNGYGQMWYSDGTFYDGDWFDDGRHGKGISVQPDGNRYEGSWKDDMKHGSGTYYFLQSGQIQEGIWYKDVPSVSAIIDIPYRQSCLKPTLFPIPKNCLADADYVLTTQEKRVLEGLSESCPNEPSSWDAEDLSI